MTTLLTGATGFLGSALYRALIDRGEKLRVFTRSPKKLPPLPDSVEIFPGDLADPEAIYEAVRGVDRIYHVASIVKQWLPDPSLYEQVNVFAWETLLRAAMAEGVSKIVYTSSFMALGPTPEGGAGDESLIHTAKHFNNAYEKTKYRGYQVAKQYIEKGAPVVCVFPGVIFGPGPLTEGNFALGLLQQIAQGKLKALPGAGRTVWCYSFVEDVVKGHILAMEKGRIGSGYILGGENLSLAEFCSKACPAAGMKPPSRSVPLFAAKAGAALLEKWGDFRKKEPAITKGAVGVLAQHWAYSSTRAQSELGYAATPFDEALEKTVSWMQSEKLI